MDKKAKHYAGILALLEHENLTSMLLSMRFRECIMRGCNLSSEEMEAVMNYAYEKLNTDISCIYIHWD